MFLPLTELFVHCPHAPMMDMSQSTAEHDRAIDDDLDADVQVLDFHKLFFETDQIHAERFYMVGRITVRGDFIINSVSHCCAQLGHIEEANLSAIAHYNN